MFTLQQSDDNFFIASDTGWQSELFTLSDIDIQKAGYTEDLSTVFRLIVVTK